MKINELFSWPAGHPEFDGIEVKLFAMIADRLNFTYDIRNRNGPYRFVKETRNNSISSFFFYITL